MSNTQQHHRRSIRLEGYDYTQAGAYFVTIVTAGRVARFGAINNGEAQLNPVGEMVQREWQRLPGRFAGLEMNAFVIMPNHIHGILILCPQPGMGDGSIPPSTAAYQIRPHVDPGALGAILRAFKSSTTLHFHRMRGESGPLWQRNYYDHILRGPADLERSYAYIQANPFHEDADFPASLT